MILPIVANLILSFSVFGSQMSHAGIVRHCMVVKGNGANWASTLAFMSQTLEIKAIEARTLAQATGEPVLVSLNCFAGASSGAAAAVVYAALLRNPYLSKDTSDASLRSPEELENLSKALRFLSIATDYTFKEKFQLIHSAVRFALSGGLVDFENSGWWQKFFMEDDVAISLFGKLAVVARHLQPSDFNRSIHSVTSEGTANLVTRYNIKSIVDLPMWAFIRDIPYFKSEVGTQLHRLYREQAQIIHKVSENIYRSAGGNDFLLDTLLLEPMPDGFCMGAMVEFSEVGKLSKKLPAYDQLRTMVICNQNTIHAIRSHPDYSNYLAQFAPYSRRMIFASAMNLKSAFRISIREYQIFKAQLETFQTAGISAYYEDKTEFVANHLPQLKRGMFGNLGGWVPEKVLAIPMSWYLASQDNEHVLVNHLSMFGYLSDGKVGPFSDIWFLRTIMGHNGRENPVFENELYVKNMFRDYRAYQEVLDKVFLDGPLGKYKLDYRTTKVNWNLHLAPAALTGEGINLLAMTLNETKRMEGDQGASNMPIYADWIEKCVYTKRLDHDMCEIVKNSFSAFSQPYGLTFVPDRIAIQLQPEVPWWAELDLD